MKWSLALAAGALLFAGAASAAVNVNTAQQSELQRTRGLDKHKAKAIIDYRNQNGPFATLEELEKVRGFDRTAIDKLKPELALTGPPYTPPPAPEKPAAKKK